jgi:hypothetical protein
MKSSILILIIGQICVDAAPLLDAYNNSFVDEPQLS